MKNVLSLVVVAFAVSFTAGCGEPQTQNVMENSDAQALADYERMIEEEAAMSDEAAPDTEQPQ